MRMIKTTLIVLAIVSTSAVGAFARDGVGDQNLQQQGTDGYYTDTYGVVDEGPVIIDNSPSVIFVAPPAYVDGADRAIIHQNAREPK